FMTPDGLIGAFAAYNAIALQVARAEGVIAIGGENDIPGDPQHFTDSVHFSDAGSRSMAERVSKALLAAPAFRALLEQHSGRR
ncbi:MAG TPA: hypothetical protein VMK05_08330, partial [Burkholderiales bacterium]|nr:hypothetical protein [Burkholderiales bacterium]